LRWFGYAEQEYDADRMTVEVGGSRESGCPRKTWLNDVKGDIRSSGLSKKMHRF